MCPVVEYMYKRLPDGCFRFDSGQGAIRECFLYPVIRMRTYDFPPFSALTKNLGLQFCPIRYQLLVKTTDDIFRSAESCLPDPISKQHVIQRPVNALEEEAHISAVVLIRNRP